MSVEWWWVRNSEATHQTIRCHANAAQAALRSLVLCAGKHGRWVAPPNAKLSDPA